VAGPSLPTSTPLPGAKGHRDSIILAVACVAQFMVILDVSVVNVALPSIGRSLHYSATGLQWVVNAYVLAFAGFLLLGGRAADFFGQRRIFLLGAILFSAASLVGGFAETSAVLTGARVAQGLGAALLAPATLTILVTTFSGPRLPKALGAWGAVGGSGGAIGSALGGILTAEFSWRWVLFINVPIGIAVIVVALIFLPEVSHRTAASKLDVAGAVLVTAGLTCLVYAIVGTNTHPWGSTTTIAWLSVAAVLLAGFALVETTLASDPLVPFSYFRNRTTAGANTVMFLIGTAVFSLWYFLSLFFQEVLGMSALRTGFAFIPLTVAIIIGTQVTARSMPKIGPWPIILVGTAVATIGFFWLGHLHATSTYLGDVFIPASMVTFAIGLLFSPLAVSATSQVGPAQTGLASGVLNSSRQIGGSIGLAVLATVAVDATRSMLPASSHPNFGGATSLAAKEALSYGYSQAFLLASLSMLLAFAATFVIPRVTDVAALRRAPAPTRA